MDYQMVLTDYVMWPWKVKLVTLIRLERNISKTAGDRDHQMTINRKWHMETTKGPLIGNDIWVSHGHVTDDVTWPPKLLWGSTVGYPSNSLASC